MQARGGSQFAVVSFQFRVRKPKTGAGESCLPEDQVEVLQLQKARLQDENTARRDALIEHRWAGSNALNPQRAAPDETDWGGDTYLAHTQRGCGVVKIERWILAGLLWAAPVWAQGEVHTPAQSGQGAAPVIRVSSELVVLDVLVENKMTGAPIGNLEAKDFVVTEDGAPQQISYFSRDQLPLSVVVMFDLTETVQPILKPLAEGAVGGDGAVAKRVLPGGQ